MTLEPGASSSSAPPPCALTIAGSDTSGGAGIPADLKTFARFGVYGLSVVTAVTAQTGRRVLAVRPLPVGLVESQLDAALATAPCRAVKIGMLGSAAVVRSVAARCGSFGPLVPIVLDPVLAASDGTSLLDEAGFEALRRELLPRVTLLTPNRPEAERLTDLEIKSSAQLEEAGHRLNSLGPAVLIKGGHGTGERVADLLFCAGEVHRFERRRIAGPGPHGTGCVLSAAITAVLARGGFDLAQAVERGIGYLVDLLKRPLDLGGGIPFLGVEGLGSNDDT